MTENRRSAPELVAFFDHLFDDANGVFSRIAGAPPADYEPRYEKALRGEAPPDRPRIGCYLLTQPANAEDAPEPGEAEDSEPSVDAGAEGEAEWIAGQSDALLRPGASETRPLRLRDIAILRYSVRNVGALTLRLARRNIPYYVVGSRGLLERPEIRDVLEWVRLLRRPEDDLALAACAKQPWIGLSDRRLLALRQAPPESFEWPPLPAGAAAVGGRLFHEWPFIVRHPVEGILQEVHDVSDVILEENGALRIFDYKTGHQPPRHYAVQMALYRAALAAAQDSSTAVPHPILLYVERG